MTSSVAVSPASSLPSLPIIRSKRTFSLLRSYCENQEQPLLQIIARKPEIVPELDVEFLLRSLEKQYWRMRIFEALIRHDIERAVGLSASYPREFVDAVGRCRTISLSEVIRNLSVRYQDDLEFIALYVRTLGKIRDRNELGRVNAIVEQKISNCQKV